MWTFKVRRDNHWTIFFIEYQWQDLQVNDIETETWLAWRKQVYKSQRKIIITNGATSEKSLKYGK